MSSYALSLLLAVIACVIGGALGGIALARPAQMLGLAGLAEGETAPTPLLSEGRAVGGLLVLSHAGAALYLGYQPGIGAAMASGSGPTRFIAARMSASKSRMTGSIVASCPLAAATANRFTVRTPLLVL